MGIKTVSELSYVFAYGYKKRWRRIKRLVATIKDANRAEPEYTKEQPRGNQWIIIIKYIVALFD